MNSTASTIKVSVIIVSWNARNYLVQCLKTLTEKACRYPMEIIVVDNDSKDGSPECVEQDFPHVRLIRTGANLGFGRANNLGIAQSRGRYLALINSDVEVLPECLTRLVDYAEAHSEVGMVGPRIIGRDGKLQRSCRGFPSVWNMFCRSLALDSIFPRVQWFAGYALTHWPQEDERPVDILTGCFWLIRREAFNQVGGLDEAFFMYGEDMDWCRRFWTHGWRLMLVPTAEAIHYGGASSSNSPVRFYLEMQRADLQYWAKHHSRPAVICFYLICCLHMVLRTLGYSLAALLGRGERATRRYKVQRSVACLKWLLGAGMRHWKWLFRTSENPIRPARGVVSPGTNVAPG